MTLGLHNPNGEPHSPEKSSRLSSGASSYFLGQKSLNSNLPIYTTLTSLGLPSVLSLTVINFSLPFRLHWVSFRAEVTSVFKASSESPLFTSIEALFFPWTWIITVMVSLLRCFGSYSGHGALEIDSVCPSDSQISSATCGANGESRSMNFSRSALLTPFPAEVSV